MRIKEFGTTKEIYESLVGPLMIEGSAIAEIMYLTKYIGNYNVNKIGNLFVFENEGYAITLERI
jgi:hypothetical protein